MEPKDQENLHRWLDRALVEYGNTEPRPGLEARVLANLSAERERITARQGWFWALTLTATAAVIILAVWMESNYWPAHQGTDIGDDRVGATGREQTTTCRNSRT